MTRLARLGLLVLLLLPLSLSAQDRRAMTTDDGLDMVRVGDAMISPDGAWVFYSLSELDWEENEREETYYMVSAEGGDPFPFIGEEGGSSFEFSPRGTYLSFTRSVDGDRQLFLMRTAGGEAIQLTDHEESVGRYVWADDESRIYFTADDPRDPEVEKEIENGADAIFVDEGPNGQGVDRWNDFWWVEVGMPADPVEPTRLTEEQHIVGSFDVSPDGRRIVYTRRTENRRNQGNLSEIHLLDVATGEDRALTANAAPEGSPTFSPDGTRIAFEAPDDEEWELRNDKIWVMGAEGGEPRTARPSSSTDSSAPTPTCTACRWPRARWSSSRTGRAPWASPTSRPTTGGWSTPSTTSTRRRTSGPARWTTAPPPASPRPTRSSPPRSPSDRAR